MIEKFMENSKLDVCSATEKQVQVFGPFRHPYVALIGELFPVHLLFSLLEIKQLYVLSYRIILYKHPPRRFTHIIFLFQKQNEVLPHLKDEIMGLREESSYYVPRWPRFPSSLLSVPGHWFPCLWCSLELCQATLCCLPSGLGRFLRLDLEHLFPLGIIVQETSRSWLRG